MPRVRFYSCDPSRFDVRSGSRDLNRDNRYLRPDETKEGDGVHRSPPHHPTVGHGSTAPTTELEALMLAPPGVEPEESVAEQLKLRTQMADAVDTLSPRERYIIEALFYERVSLRDLAIRMGLGKTQVSRIRDHALSLLRSSLYAAERVREAHGESDA